MACGLHKTPVVLSFCVSPLLAGMKGLDAGGKCGCWHLLDSVHKRSLVAHSFCSHSFWEANAGSCELSSRSSWATQFQASLQSKTLFHTYATPRQGFDIGTPWHLIVKSQALELGRLWILDLLLNFFKAQSSVIWGFAFHSFSNLWSTAIWKCWNKFLK